MRPVMPDESEMPHFCTNQAVYFRKEGIGANKSKGYGKLSNYQQDVRNRDTPDDVSIFA